jgi:magnesium chelatase family protein
MSLFRTHSAAVFGIQAHPVEIEAEYFKVAEPKDICMVGMPDTVVRESRNRIKSAFANSGFHLGASSVTVNLAPAQMRKTGAGYDLPIATAILGAMGHVQKSPGCWMVGELALDGTLRQVRGVLSIAMAARREGVKSLVVPKENAGEAAVVEGLRVFGVTHLSEAVGVLNQPEQFEYTRTAPAAAAVHAPDMPDFCDVKGQTTAKRALEVAAAGGHNVLLVGPPGSGKTMLAKRVAGILPSLTFEESLETTQVHSVAGVLPEGAALLNARPFRSPHHTISDAGLLGGGPNTPRPGEVSLAHNGVLFLDELPEFPRNVLEILRQPLEERSVCIARAQMSLTFPASFMLVAAMNPCPCGFFGDPTRECRCTGAIIQRYLGKISGPLLDRIDLHIEVPAVPFQELRSRDQCDSSAAIRDRVLAARALQNRRGFSNSQVPPGKLREVCPLDAAGERTLEMAVRRMGLSARAHDRILKVARTISDLSGSPTIQAKHLAEAIQYRSLDRSYWT